MYEFYANHIIETVTRLGENSPGETENDIAGKFERRNHQDDP